MGKKRRKAVYVHYDYETAYKNSLDKMEEANEERILKEGKVKSIYATKEIRSGDQLEVEIYPEFTKGQKDQIPDEGKRKRQRQAQKNLNDKNSKKMCERVIGENFTDRDIWATFTYTDENMPASMEVATKNMQNYIRRLNYQRKKQGLSNARYVYVTECSEKGRWHHHIVMDGDVDMDTVEAVWNLGRKTLNIICAVWDFIARHPAMLAMPLIIFLLVLTIQMHEFEKQVQAWDQEIRQQQEQIEELYDRQDPVEQTDMTDVYGCKSLYGTYDFPWNTMSQDWGSDQVTGFYYHEISEECKAAGGELPTIIQVYTYIVCEQNGVDYEMVFALIEQESRCRWDAEGDNGTSIGLMQVSEKWHMQRMEELGAYDLTNPYQNVLVGVNYLSEIQNDLRGTVSDEDLPYYTLAVYNYGKQGAKANLWDQGVVKYTYNTKIMDRAQQLKEEKKKAEEGRR